MSNNIKAPISNFEMISSEAQVKAMYHKIDSLRNSRDITSKLQLTQLALRKGLSSTADLESLIKAEPSFDRQMLMDKLEKASRALEILAKKISKVHFAIIGSEDFMNGTWNAKKVLNLQLMIGSLNAEKAKAIYAQELKAIEASIGADLKIEVISFDIEKNRNAIFFSSDSKNVLTNYYENKILKKLGLNKEIDKNGGVRFREITESAGGIRCEAVLL